MMNNKNIILSVVLIGIMFIFSSFPDSEAKLWDYLIDVEFLENPISQGTNPVLIGKVVDHAYRPVGNVDVKISFAGDSYLLKTDRHGEFGKQLNANDLKPRTYAVHILASTDNGKKGMTSSTLEIDGHTEKSAKFERQIYYLEQVNDVSKLRFSPNDPISVILYEHYLALKESATKAELEEQLLDVPQQKIREARQLAHEKLIEALEKRPLTMSQFDISPKFSKFLETLDDDTRSLFELQLNSTMMRFMDSKSIFTNVLISGGTLDDARQAYLDNLSITHEEMNLIIEDMEKTQISSKLPTNSTEN